MLKTTVLADNYITKIVYLAYKREKDEKTRKQVAKYYGQC